MQERYDLSGRYVWSYVCSQQECGIFFLQRAILIAIVYPQANGAADSVDSQSVPHQGWYMSLKRVLGSWGLREYPGGKKRLSTGHSWVWTNLYTLERCIYPLSLTSLDVHGSTDQRYHKLTFVSLLNKEKVARNEHLRRKACELYQCESCLYIATHGVAYRRARSSDPPPIFNPNCELDTNCSTRFCH